MHYKLRWLYAGSVMMLVFLAGAIIELLPRWQAIQMAWQEEKLLQNNILKLPKIRVVTNASSIDAHIYLAPLIMSLAARQGMNVNKLSQLAKGDLHLVAEGSYESAMQFLPQLTAHYGLVTFAFRAIGNNKIELLADIANTQTGVVQAILPPLSPLHNPFCWQASNELVSAQEVQQKINQTKLADLQLVASLQYHHHANAWLLLPDQTLAAVAMGDVIGVEQARVVALDRQSITLETSDNHQVIMRMQ